VGVTLTAEGEAEMLVQRPYSATATDLPLNPAATRSMGPMVAVLGHPGRVAALPAHLPNGWTVRRARDLDDVQPDEIVLFSNAAVADVTAGRRILPRRTLIVALVDTEAPAELVAGVLTAGADVCVRAGQPAILASHLVACRRRQLTGRGTGLQDAAAAGQA
jgi:hypothetical protein